MASERQKNIGVPTSTKEELADYKQSYEDWLGEKVGWGRFLLDIAKLAFSGNNRAGIKGKGR